MAEFCKVCGIILKAINTVDYRPGSCRDCELERKKLYSGISVEFGSSKNVKRSSKKKKSKSKKHKNTKISKSKNRRVDKKG